MLYLLYHKYNIIERYFKLLIKKVNCWTVLSDLNGLRLFNVQTIHEVPEFFPGNVPCL